MKLGDTVRFSRELKKHRHKGWYEEKHETQLCGIVCGEWKIKTF